MAAVNVEVPRNDLHEATVREHAGCATETKKGGGEGVNTTEFYLLNGPSA